MKNRNTIDNKEIYERRLLLWHIKLMKNVFLVEHAQELPMNCISQEADKYVIDPATCIDCGTCAGVCPVEAPVAE